MPTESKETRGRPTAGKRHTQVIRIPESELLEIYLHNPSMVSPQGGVRYGAMQEYILNLIRQDLEPSRNLALKNKAQRGPSNVG